MFDNYIYDVKHTRYETEYLCIDYKYQQIGPVNLYLF